jgi:hypothetical protein
LPAKRSSGEQNLERLRNFLAALDHVSQYLQGYRLDLSDRFVFDCVQFRRGGSPPWQPSFYSNRGEGERLANIRLFEVRKVSEQLLHRAPGGDGFDAHPNGYAHAPDAWLPAHHFRIDHDTLQLLYVFMVRLLKKMPNVSIPPAPRSTYI